MSEARKAPLIDTNLLVYAYAEDSPKKAAAMELLQRCLHGEARLHIALQNIGEFYSVALHRYSTDPAKVDKIIQALLRCETLVKLHYHDSTFQRALALAGKGTLRFWDAMLVATMIEHGVESIYTEDASIRKVDGIKAINPFIHPK